MSQITKNLWSLPLLACIIFCDLTVAKLQELTIISELPVIVYDIITIDICLLTYFSPFRMMCRLSLVMRIASILMKWWKVFQAYLGQHNQGNYFSTNVKYSLNV